jgi:hypothetical protein
MWLDFTATQSLCRRHISEVRETAMKPKVGDEIFFRCDRFMSSDGEERSGRITRIDGDMIQTTGGIATDMRDVKPAVWDEKQQTWVVRI